MTRRGFLMLAAVLLATPASAARQSLIGFEGGCEAASSCSPSAAQFSTGGTPTVEATSGLTGVDAGNDWSLRINPAAAAAEYVEQSITATHELTQHILFCPRTDFSATGGTQKRIILEARHSGSGQRTCFAQLEDDMRVRVYYQDDANECGGSFNDGTTCTDLNNCESDPNGAETCSEAYFATSSTQLVSGTCYSIALTQDTSQANPGDVSCGLYFNGQLRGAGVRRQGVCQGIGNPRLNWACSTDTDCRPDPGDSYTCDVTTVRQADRIVVGSTETTGAPEFDASVDNFARDNTVDATLTYVRVIDLHPNATSLEGATDTTGCSGGSNNHQCVDDTISGTGGNDGNTTYLQFDQGNKDRWGLEDVQLNDACTGAGAPAACCTGADAGTCETLQANAAVALTCALRETSDNGNTNKLVQLGLYDGSNETFPAGYDVAALGQTYAAIPPQLHLDPPGAATAWTTTPESSVEAQLNGLQFALQHGGTSGSGWRIRATDCHAEVEITKAAAPKPDQLADLNGDAEITAGVLGSSRLADGPFWATLSGIVEDVDNLFQYAQGGRLIENAFDETTAIAAGQTNSGQHFPRVVRKGTTSTRALDYLFLCLGDNNFVYQGTAPRDGICKLPSTPGPGTPTPTPGGGTHGGPCLFADGQGRSVEIFEHRCTGAVNFTGACFPPVPGHQGEWTCTSPQVDTISCLNGLCREGRLGSPQCLGGVCETRSKPSAVDGAFYQRLLDQLAARMPVTKTRPIIVLPYRPEENGTDDADRLRCPWWHVRDDFAARRAWVRQQVTARGWNWVDIDGELLRRCDWGRVNCCLRDGMHLTTALSGPGSADWRADCPSPLSVTGADVVAELFEDCLEGVANANVHCPNMKATVTPTRTPTATPVPV